MICGEKIWLVFVRTRRRFHVPSYKFSAKLILFSETMHKDGIINVKMADVRGGGLNREKRGVA